MLLAEELLADLRGAAGRAEEATLRPSGRAWAAEGGPGCGEEHLGGGTTREVVAWLGQRLGALPLVWPGLEAAPVQPGWIELRRAAGPAAVLVWDKETLDSSAPSLDLPPDLFPVMTDVTVVLAARPVQRGRPLPGEKIRGEILWSRRGVGPVGARKESR